MKYYLLTILTFLHLFSFTQSEGPNSPTLTNTNTTTGTINWNNPSNANASGGGTTDTDAMSKDDVSYYLVASDFNFNIPLNATITGIEVVMTKSATPNGNGNIKDNEVKIIKGGVIRATNQKDNGNWGFVSTNTTYGASNDMWGEVWTPSDINSSNFGVAISVTKNGNVGTKVAQIDHITITVYYLVPLPIELVNFNASPDGDIVKLTWTTLSEINNDYFCIERSLNGNIFEEIGRISGSGNSNNIIKYYYYDNRAYINTLLYYRLKQVDFDGTFEYSNVIPVSRDIKPLVYYDGVNIRVITPDVSPEVKIYELSGKEITITDQLVSGVYFIQVKSFGTYETFKIIVK